MKKNQPSTLIWLALAILLSSALSFETAVAAPAASVVGDWQGTLTAGTTSLRVVLHIAQDKDGKLTATIDSPDQGGANMPVSAITFTSPDFHLESQQIASTFDGKANADNSEIAGEWKQGDSSFPLVFKRMAKKTASINKTEIGEGGAKAILNIPFDLYEDLIYVPVSVNGSRALRFAIDTGASYALVSDKTAQEIGLHPDQREQVGLGSGQGNVKLWHAKDVSFSLGNIQISSPDALVASLQDINRMTGQNLDGVLGADLFRRYVVEIDYAARRIRLFEPETFVYHGAGEGIPLTIAGVPLTKASVALPDRAPIDGLFVVDTGSHRALGLNSPFVQKNNLLEGLKAISSSDVSIGGEWPKMVGRLQTFQIGRFVLDRPVTDFSQATSGQRSNAAFAGVIGGEVLRRFKVIFDYSRQLMILEPNAELKQPFADDASGLLLSAEGIGLNAITVLRVLGNSPAAEAGLYEGDVITGIAEEKAPQAISLAKAREMFLQPGHVYIVVVARGDRVLRLRISTHQLI